MRFHLRALAVTPILLLILAVFSRPLDPSLSSRKAELRRVSYKPSSLNLPSRGLGLFEELQERSKEVQPYRRVKEKKKLTLAEQQARKAGAKAATQKATTANMANRRHWETLEKQKKARTDRPKRPKPPMVKGATPSSLANRKQQQAKDKIAKKKELGAAKFAQAKAAYSKMTNLPGRHVTFTKNGETATGRQVRNAVFNSHYFSPNSAIFNQMNPSQKKAKSDLARPKEFMNRPEGPKGSKFPPVRSMKKGGAEFPIGLQHKNGFQGGGDVKGNFRVITQGNQFKAVVAHDASRTDPTKPGYMDHFQVRPRPPPRPFRGIQRDNKPLKPIREV